MLFLKSQRIVEVVFVLLLFILRSYFLFIFYFFQKIAILKRSTDLIFKALFVPDLVIQRDLSILLLSLSASLVF